MDNVVYEFVISLAKYMVANGKTCSFDTVAQSLNTAAGCPQYKGGRGTARVVAGAYHYADRNNRPDDAQAVADAFRNKQGRKAY